MVQINFAQKQVNAKVVYYGPGMSGKTTNLEVIHQRAPEQNRGDLTSISTDGDRTLFFDFMPLDLGTVAGMRTCFQIYTVPGQVYYNSTRKLVLQGVDGVVFVADSSASMVQENIESLRNLEENLNEYGKSLATTPLVIQYNKRDLPDALPVEELEQILNANGVPTFEGIANTGQGVFPTLKALAGLVLEQIHQSYGSNDSQDSGGGSGMTGYYPAQNAPSHQAPAQHYGAPAASGAGQFAQTNFHNAPVAHGQTGFHRAPAHPQSQTGFHQAASATSYGQPNMGQKGPGFQGGEPRTGFHQRPAGIDPLSRTNVHAPPQFGGQGGGNSSLRMARGDEYAGGGASQQHANFGHGAPQPGLAVEPRMGGHAQRQQAPMHAAPQSAGSMMHPEPSQHPNGQQPRGGRPQEGPRLRPRAANPRPTPVERGSNRSAVFTVIFVVAALGAGAVLGRILLSLL